MRWLTYPKPNSSYPTSPAYSPSPSIRPCSCQGAKDSWPSHIARMVKAAERKVPDTIQKVRSRIAQADTQRAAERTALRGHHKAAREVALAKAIKYTDEYINAELEEAHKKAQAKHEQNVWVPAEAKVALVIRIKGINKMAPKPKKILQLFRLRQIFNAVLIKLNKATMNMLRVIEPFVAYGFPSRHTISKLVYKRGFAKVNHQRLPITSNDLVEQQLGKVGVTCVEDIVHELVTCGPHFKEASRFLWPFKLNAPRKGFVAKRHSFIEGGDWGNREDKINDLATRML